MSIVAVRKEKNKITIGADSIRISGCRVPLRHHDRGRSSFGETNNRRTRKEAQPNPVTIMNHPLSWRTEKRRVNDLVPHGKNPRRMSEKQLDDLKRSIEKFNLVELPACDADGTILAGHQRMKVLQILGRGDEEIEVRLRRLV